MALQAQPSSVLELVAGFLKPLDEAQLCKAMTNSPWPSQERCKEVYRRAYMFSNLPQELLEATNSKCCSAHGSVVPGVCQEDGHVFFVVDQHFTVEFYRSVIDPSIFVLQHSGFLPQEVCSPAVCGIANEGLGMSICFEHTPEIVRPGMKNKRFDYLVKRINSQEIHSQVEHSPI